MFTLIVLDYVSWLSKNLNSSDLVQKVAINEVAENMMAFNTNYKDTGLFGVYAVAKVGSVLIISMRPLFYYAN